MIVIWRTVFDTMNHVPPLSSKGRRGRRKRRPGHNLALRLRDHRDSVLRFTMNPRVPPANNLAEAGCAARKGAAEDLRQLSQPVRRDQPPPSSGRCPATARKQGWNMPDTLHRSPHELSTALVAKAQG